MHLEQRDRLTTRLERTGTYNRRPPPSAMQRAHLLLVGSEAPARHLQSGLPPLASVKSRTVSDLASALGSRRASLPRSEPLIGQDLST